MILFLKVLSAIFITFSIVSLLAGIFYLVRFHKRRHFFIFSSMSCALAILFVVFLAWSQHVSDTEAASAKETKVSMKEENNKEIKEESKEETKESTKEENNEDSEAVSDSVESKEAQDQIIADLEEAAGEVEEEVKANEDRFFSLLQSNFEDVANVRFDEENKVFYIDSTDEDFAKEVMMFATGVKSLDTWNVLVSEYQKTSLLLKNEVADGYTISLSNPMNPENTILMITDGVVVYDAVTAEQQ